MGKIMNKLFMLGFASVLAAGSLQMAQATYPAPDAGVVATADMEVVSSQNFFRSPQDVQMDLTRRSDDQNVVGLNLRYTLPNISTSMTPDQKVSYALGVDSVSKDECGSTIYVARLGNSDPSQPVGPRLSLVLVDHLTRTCRDYQPYRWEARLRSGFGWCGTGDAVLKLRGNPAPSFHPN